MKKATTVSELTQMLTAIFQVCGLSPNQAVEHGAEAAEAFRLHWAGWWIYFPKRNGYGKKAQEVYAAHTFGKQTFKQISEHFNISVSQAFRMCKRIEKEFTNGNEKKRKK
jgi:Mor family transcriptional regulator